MTQQHLIHFDNPVVHAQHVSLATELTDHPEPGHTLCDLATHLTHASVFECVNNIKPTVPVVHTIVASDPDLLPQSDDGLQVTVCLHQSLFWHFQMHHGAVKAAGEE